ncbi:ABC transporter permease [Aggregatibacter kilianii]|uniref:ABC transporter permease n=1 Tax=Aggregatibacter kilianii TaxID=2025884 RepID=UPI000D645129|nr:ABC transporter permease [Aggregatibacter kilianii]
MTIFKALTDLKDSIRQHYLWRTLAWYDILGRYRRSTLGPIWITISMAITVSAMGPLYGALFNFDPSDFIPHLALGLIFWALISSSINESAYTFSESAHYMKQAYIPAPIFVFRIVYRQFIVFAHNIMLFPIIMFILWRPITSEVFLFFPAFLLVLINIFFITLLVSIFCGRYRDMAQVLSSIMSLLFFVTPIIWRMEQLSPERQAFIHWNIFATFLDLVRKPLLGITPTLQEWSIAGISAVCFAIVSVFILARTRHRITYWL